MKCVDAFQLPRQLYLESMGQFHHFKCRISFIESRSWKRAPHVIKLIHLLPARRAIEMPQKGNGFLHLSNFPRWAPTLFLAQYSASKWNSHQAVFLRISLRDFQKNQRRFPRMMFRRHSEQKLNLAVVLFNKVFFFSMLLLCCCLQVLCTFLKLEYTTVLRKTIHKNY